MKRAVAFEIQRVPSTILPPGGIFNSAILILLCAQCFKNALTKLDILAIGMKRAEAFESQRVLPTIVLVIYFIYCIILCRFYIIGFNIV